MNNNYKVQLGDKVKMLKSTNVENMAQLIQAAKASYPKRLADKEISLKYADEDGDWFYLSDESDFVALNEHAAGQKKKVKLVKRLACHASSAARLRSMAPRIRQAAKAPSVLAAPRRVMP